MRWIIRTLTVSLMFLVWISVSTSEVLADCKVIYSPQGDIYTNSELKVQIVDRQKGYIYRVNFGPKRDEWIFRWNEQANETRPYDVIIPLSQLRTEDNNPISAGNYVLNVIGIDDKGILQSCLAEYGNADTISLEIKDAQENPDPDASETLPSGDYGVQITYYAPDGSTMNEADGSTTHFSANFFGFNEDSYDVCFFTDQSHCLLKDKFVEKNKSQLNFSKLCGDGVDKLKDDCDQDRDYFHEGQIYSIGIYSKTNYSSPLFLHNIYINHIYPRIITYKDDGTNIMIYDPTSETPPPNEDILIQNPIDILITSFVKVGKNKTNRNNFQYSIESRTGGYYFQDCGALSGETGDNSGLRIIFGDNHSTTSPIRPGSYIIKIKEQINEDKWYRLRTDNCQGGFTYYSIPVEVKHENGKFQAYINPASIEKDPDGLERIQIKDGDNFSALPCTKWERIVNGKKEEVDVPSPGDKCIEYETAIGSFGVTPLAFVKTFGSWLLGIASVAAFAILIYSGYILMTSRGDKEKISQARDRITSAITGLIFIILSIAILEIIGVDILHIPGFSR